MGLVFRRQFRRYSLPHVATVDNQRRVVAANAKLTVVPQGPLIVWAE